MRNWKRQWKRELDAVIPPLKSEATKPQKRKHDFRRTVSLVGGLAAMLAICFVIVFSLLPKTPPVDPTDDTPSVTYLSVEVNPSVCFVADKDGIVTKVLATNQDADVVLLDDERMTSLMNVPLTQAVQTYVDYAAELGYLNLVDGDAVRMSMCEGYGEPTLVENVKKELTVHLREKGIFAAVLSHSQGVGDFLSATGMKMDALEDEFKNVSSLYTKRHSQDKSLEDIVEEYKRDIIGNQLEEYIQEVYDDVSQRKQRIEELQSYHAVITEHEDNTFALDFWSFHHAHFSHISKELEKALEDMDLALGTYEKDFHVNLNSYLSFMAEVALVEQMPLDDIETLLGDFTVDKCLENPAPIIEVLLWSGLKMESIHALTQIPTSHEDYQNKMKDALTAEGEHRYREHGESYHEERPSISEDDYMSRLDELEREHGSLDEYWDHVKGHGKHKK